MFNKNLVTKTDFTYNQYLSNLDIINKYSIQGRKKIPCFKRMVVSFPLRAFLPYYYNKNKTEEDLEFQIKCFTLLYMLYCQMPYINFKKQLKQKKFLKLYENNYSLKVTITKKEFIHEVLTLLFFEYSQDIFKGFLKELIKSQQKIKRKQMEFRTAVFTKNFFELKFLSNIINIGYDSKEFFINLKFNFFSSLKENSDRLIRNISPFWILKY